MNDVFGRAVSEGVGRSRFRWSVELDGIVLNTFGVAVRAFDGYIWYSPLVDNKGHITDRTRTGAGMTLPPTLKPGVYHNDSDPTAHTYP